MAKKERNGGAVENPVFATVTDWTDLAAQLELLEIYVARSLSASVIDEGAARSVQRQLHLAGEDAMRNSPDGGLILDHLLRALDRVNQVDPDHRLVEPLEEAVQAARRLA